MLRVLHRLTAIRVKTAPKGLWSDGGNLCLQCSEAPDGGIRRSWIFRYSKGGKEHQLGLGAAHTITLAEARQAATELRKLLYQGQDPLGQKRTMRASQALQQAKAVTFDTCVDGYIKSHQDGWRNEKHRKQWQNTLETFCGPVLGKIAVQDIDTALVLRVLEPLWKDRTETASRLRGRIEAVLDWSAVKGFRSAQIPNPARWKGHLDHLLPARIKVQKVQHHPSMAYAELPAFMAKLRQREGVAALALEFLILNASRSDEVLGALWSEIDLDARTWTVPGERMKGNRHELPRLRRSARASVAGRHPVLAHGLDDVRNVGMGVAQELLGLAAFPWWSKQWTPLVVHAMQQDGQ
jgi:hypothetical protein